MHLSFVVFAAVLRLSAGAKETPKKENNSESKPSSENSNTGTRFFQQSSLGFIPNQTSNSFQPSFFYPNTNGFQRPKHYDPNGFYGGQHPYNNGKWNPHHTTNPYDFLGLPQQIRVPGNINVRLTGPDAELSCEFPRYLILIQSIYWHHKFEDAYGSFYDATNGFGPKITVVPVDQWKSLLIIRNYNEEDFGSYRCISSAILPEPNQQIQNVPPSGGFNNNYSPRSEKLTSTDHPYQFEEISSKPLKSRAINSKKFRFSRELRREKSAPKEPTAESSQIYDPFNRNKENSPRHFWNSHNGWSNNNYFNPNNNFNPTSNYLPQNNYVPPNNFIPTNSYLPSPSPSYGTNPYTSYPTNYPNYNYRPQHQQHFFGWGDGGGGDPNYNFQHEYHKHPGFSLNAPYYKPNYSVFTIFQEVNFAPSIPPPTQG